MLRGGWGITYAQTGNGQSDGGSTLGAGGWNTINFQSPAFGEPGALAAHRSCVQPRRAVQGGEQRRHPSIAGAGRFAAAMDSSRLRQDAEAQSVERLDSARNHARSRRRRRVCRQSGRRVHGEQSDQPQRDQRSIGCDRSVWTSTTPTIRHCCTSRLDSPLAASRGFNKLPYAGYSGANTVAQSLRPFPQFGTISALGVPLGESKYDSLQVKAEQAVLAGLEPDGDLHVAERADEHRDRHGHDRQQRLRSSRRRVLRAGTVGAADHACGVQLRSAGVHAESIRARRASADGRSAAWCVTRAALPIPVPASQNQLECAGLPDHHG